MQDSNILKCKNESKRIDITNGGSNIAEGQDLIKKEIASKRKYETIDEEFINDEGAGNFI